MKKLIFLSAGLALAACNSDSDGTYQTENGKGSYKVEGSGDDAKLTITTAEGEATFQSGPDARISLPAGFTLYPGATVISNTTFNNADKKTATLTMNTGDSLDKVVAFYKKQAAAADVKIETEINAGGAVMLGGNNPAGMVFGLNAGPADSGGTTAHLSLADK